MRVSTRSRAAISANIEAALNSDRPDPCWRAIGRAVISERRYMQIVRFGDLLEPFLLPCHTAFLLACRPAILSGDRHHLENCRLPTIGLFLLGLMCPIHQCAEGERGIMHFFTCRRRKGIGIPGSLRFRKIPSPARPSSTAAVPCLRPVHRLSPTGNHRPGIGANGYLAWCCNRGHASPLADRPLSH